MLNIGFVKGKPIWPLGKEKKMNTMVGFRAIFEADLSTASILRITGSSLYRIFVNGIFTGHGPARGPHGYYRIDEWNISSHLRQGTNYVAIEVVGYNVNSYYLLDQPAFVQAEIVVDGKVICATGENTDDFQAIMLTEKVQKVQRYSFQRPFIECYRLQQHSYDWRTNSHCYHSDLCCVETEHKHVIERNISYATFMKRAPHYVIDRGILTAGYIPSVYKKDRSLTEIGPTLRGFFEAELEVIPTNELQELLSISSSTEIIDYKSNDRLEITELSYLIVDWGVNRTGFVGASVECKVATKLYLTFDEILTDGDVDFTRLDCANVIVYELGPGKYELESFEPYTMRFMKVLVKSGQCGINDIYIREYTNPDTNRAEFNCDRTGLENIFIAGVETFRQNSADLLTDCPSRERAGWLCDSFFMSRVEYYLTGASKLERSFLENYLLPQYFHSLPAGMLPMCYPADHDDGNFIPNWALWFVLELEEYLERTGDMALVMALKSKVDGLFQYFQKFLNEDGLLEDLEQWVFIEWSKANEYTAGVNYPSNMLYAAALTATARLYKEEMYAEAAIHVRQKIKKQSFNGAFFVDQALRVDGELVLTTHTTEVCQYYAFFFDVATPETHKDLWTTLVEKFGPTRDVSKVYPDVHVANAFIGNYLRLDLMSRYQKSGKLLEQMENYFLYMSERTGTLWEHTGTQASCNHGFASHVVYWLYRDALGVKMINKATKTITIHFEENGIQTCSGVIPVEEEVIRLHWCIEENQLFYSVSVPSSYHILIINDTGKDLVELLDRSGR